MKVCVLVCMWEFHLMMINDLHDRWVCGITRRFGRKSILRDLEVWAVSGCRDMACGGLVRRLSAWKVF
jgi:hypothetical protein